MAINSINRLHFPHISIFAHNIHTLWDVVQSGIWVTVFCARFISSEVSFLTLMGWIISKFLLLFHSTLLFLYCNFVVCCVIFYLCFWMFFSSRIQASSKQRVGLSLSHCFSAPNESSYVWYLINKYLLSK